MGQLPTGRRSHRPHRLIRLFLVSLVIPPLLISTAWIIPGAFEVAATGMCPPAPPDIPPYPCSVGNYLLRMTLGAWAVLAHLVTWMAWVVLDVILWSVGLVSVAFYRSWRRG